MKNLKGNRSKWEKIPIEIVNFDGGNENSKIEEKNMFEEIRDTIWKDFKAIEDEEISAKFKIQVERVRKIPRKTFKGDWRRYGTNSAKFE